MHASMSHFTVLVIGPDPAAQLQPFHEFECTGTDDQYVVDVDITDEVRAEYESETTTVWSIDGHRVDAGDPRLWRDPTQDEREKHGRLMGTGCGGGISWTSKDWHDGLGYRPKVWAPERAGAVRSEVPYTEAMTLLEYSRGELVAVRPGKKPQAIIKRTNPNAEWDWWVVGGRWSGFFPVRKGGAGVAGRGAGAASELRADPGNADQLFVRDVDFERARKDAANEAAREFDAWADLVERNGRARSWTEVRESMPGDIDQARAEYREQRLIAAANEASAQKSSALPFSMECYVERFGYDREAYVARARHQALVPYAIVYNGKWIAKGDMGWWGMSTDKEDPAEWAEKVSRLYDDLPPDTLLTLVDCHI